MRFTTWLFLAALAVLAIPLPAHAQVLTAVSAVAIPLALKVLLPLLGIAILGAVVWVVGKVRQLFTFLKDHAKSTDEATKLDRLDHLAETLVTSALTTFGGDLKSGAGLASAVAHVGTQLTTFGSMDTLLELAQDVFGIAASEASDYVKHLITAKTVAAAKVLTVPTAEAAAFHALPLDAQRNLLKAQGVPAL